MLDIPAEVKALFDRDSVRKNFRAVYDNGLVITNKDIVLDSFSFRESVFSGDSVTFGAAEASVVEFETVGVPNMIGEHFNAFLEVDASTLPAELQEPRGDLPFPVYSISFGRFVVTACQRDHNAMTHRKVSAMSYTSKDDLIPEHDRALLAKQFPFYNKGALEYDVSLANLALAWKEADPAYVRVKASYTKPSEYKNINIRATLFAGPALYGKVPGQNTYQRLNLKMAFVPQVSLSTLLTDSFSAARIMASDLQPVPIDDLVQQICESAAPRFDGFYTQASTNKYEPYSIEGLKSRVKYYLLAGYKTNMAAKTTSMSGSTGIGGNVYYNDVESWTTFPKIAKGAGSNNSVSKTADVIWAYELSGEGWGGTKTGSLDNPVEAYTVTGANPGIELQEFNKPLSACDAIEAIRFTVKSEKLDTAVSGGTWNYYSGFAPVKDEFLKAIEGLAELRGEFGRFTRAGQRKARGLQPDPVMRLTRGQYSSAWWDEFDLSPIGSIRYTLNSAEYVYQFGDGASQYQLNTNILDKIKNVTPEKAQAIFRLGLVPALQELVYTPAEINAVALPYLEAGDCIELEAMDGSIVRTYVLEREISGSQHMTDHIVADGVTITEV